MCVEQIHIAVAEDDPLDLMWLQTVLDHIGLEYKLTVALDGEEARDFILKEGKYLNFPPAQIIFLDMNMPKLTGLEVLRQIPDSAELPVCLLTSSPHERKLIEQHFAPKRVSYLAKPIDEKKLLECLQSHDHLRPVLEKITPRGDL
jgi:CheY-like chemotaxis protein